MNFTFHLSFKAATLNYNGSRYRKTPNLDMIKQFTIFELEYIYRNCINPAHMNTRDSALFEKVIMTKSEKNLSCQVP